MFKNLVKFPIINWQDYKHKLIVINTIDKPISAPLWLLIKCEWFANILSLPMHISDNSETISLQYNSEIISIFLDLLNNQEWIINPELILPLLQFMDFLGEIAPIKFIMCNLSMTIIVNKKIYMHLANYITINKFITLLDYLNLNDIIIMVESGYLLTLDSDAQELLKELMVKNEYTDKTYALAYIIAVYTDWQFNLQTNMFALKIFMEFSEPRSAKVDKYIKLLARFSGVVSSELIRSEIN